MEKEIINDLKEQHKANKLSQTELDEKQKEVIKQAFEEAKMPIKLTDKDFALGEGELDIRNLNKSNKEQMMFRLSILNNVYLRQIATSMVDLSRLMMLLLKQNGCEDVIKATEDLLNELSEKVSKM